MGSSSELQAALARSVGEVARRARCSVDTVRRWVRQARVHFARLPGGELRIYCDGAGMPLLARPPKARGTRRLRSR